MDSEIRMPYSKLGVMPSFHLPQDPWAMGKSIFSHLQWKTCSGPQVRAAVQL